MMMIIMDNKINTLVPTPIYKLKCKYLHFTYKMVKMEIFLSILDIGSPNLFLPIPMFQYLPSIHFTVNMGNGLVPFSMLQQPPLEPK